RHERAVRVPEADPRPRLSQGRAQHLHVFRAQDDGRARDEIVVAADQPLERQEGVRRFIQVTPGVMRMGLRAIAAASLCACAMSAQAQTTHRLEATPSTIAYGWYDAAGEPVLRIKSGDIIDVDTLLTNTPAGLQRAGVPQDQSQRAVKEAG